MSDGSVQRCSPSRLLIRQLAEALQAARLAGPPRGAGSCALPPRSTQLRAGPGQPGLAPAWQAAAVPPDAAGAKSAIRRGLRARRRALPEGDGGRALARHLRSAASDLLLAAPGVVAGFHPLPGEPNVLVCLQDAFRRGDRILLPRTLPRQHLEWVPWTPEVYLVPDRHGLQAPSGPPDPEAPATVAVMLIPALAVDRHGTRLGHGAGYYDRALAGLARWPDGPLRVAVVHPWEVLDEPLPTQAHDAEMDAVLTEQAFVLLNDHRH